MGYGFQTEDLVSKETVVLHWSESETLQFDVN